MTITDTPNPAPASPPAPSDPPKPGWQTSEFWLKLAAIALTALFASGVIPTSGTVAQVAAIAATMLGALGYTVGRSLLKAAGGLLLITLVASHATACGPTTKATATTVLTDVVDCTTADRLALEAQFGPTLEQAVQRATGQDGKIDLPSLQQLTSSLKVDGWCVAERTAAKLIAWLATKAGTASAAAPFDAKDFTDKMTTIRVQKFGATRFDVGPPL